LQADTEIQIKKMLFGVGETNVLVPFSNAVAAPKMELRKETRRHIKPGTYAVQIRNTGSTKPRIQAKEFDELTIQSDTTLNFVVEAVKGHFLYVGNRGYRDVFVVDTESNVIVDTIKLSNGVGTLAITKSGAKLYVGYGTISLVDLTTRNSRTIYDQSIAATLFTALNGSVFVVSRVHYEAPWTLGMVDTVSDVVSIIDTLDLDSMGAQEQQVAFLPNAPVLFTVSKEKKLYTYNYATKQVVRKYANLYDPLNLVISPDGQRLYCTIYADRLAVFDLWEDRIVAIVEANHRGKLMLSPDGQYLYITDPASEIPELIPSGKVYIFHTGTNTYVGDIDVKNMVPHGRSWGTDHIVLMPDGKTAFVSNGLTLIFVIDVVSRKVITAIEPRETEVQLEPMVLGPKQ
jgi:DNA-binding beta-propeller fold protein YncE